MIAARGLVLAACAVSACATAAPRTAPFTREPAALDTPFADGDRAAYVPLPRAVARTDDGDAIALSTQGGEDQARATAVALVRSVLGRDAATLDSLFAERVTLVVSEKIAPRTELVERCLSEAEALAYEQSAHSDAAIDVSALVVRRADQRGATRALAPGIRKSDLVVTLPTLRSSSAQVLRRITCLTDVYVRPGTHSQIVGIAR